MPRCRPPRPAAKVAIACAGLSAPSIGVAFSLALRLRFSPRIGSSQPRQRRASAKSRPALLVQFVPVRTTWECDRETGGRGGVTDQHPSHQRERYRADVPVRWRRRRHRAARWTPRHDAGSAAEQEHAGRTRSPSVACARKRDCARAPGNAVALREGVRPARLVELVGGNVLLAVCDGPALHARLPHHACAPSPTSSSQLRGRCLRHPSSARAFGGPPALPSLSLSLSRVANYNIIMMRSRARAVGPVLSAVHIDIGRGFSRLSCVTQACRPTHAEAPEERPLRVHRSPHHGVHFVSVARER